MEYYKDEITQVLNKIDTTTELFYQNRQQEGFEALFEIINLLSVIIDKIGKDQADGHAIPLQTEKLNGILLEALGALEQKDTVLLSDILKYELVEALEECRRKL
jgi:hypothetical protein